MQTKLMSLSPLCLSSCLLTMVNVQAAEPDFDIKLGVGIDQGFGVTAQFEDQANLFLGNDGFAADYILQRGKFDAELPLHWYVGIGAAINWDNHSSTYDKDYNAYSVRVPLGISYSFAKNWNLYGQLAPDLAYKDKPHDQHFKFGVDLGIGIRYAF